MCCVENTVIDCSYCNHILLWQWQSVIEHLYLKSTKDMCIWLVFLLSHYLIDFIFNFHLLNYVSHNL